MKYSEIAKFTDEELDKVEADSRRKIFEMRKQALTAQLKNPSRIRVLRKDIARIETEKSARAKRVAD